MKYKQHKAIQGFIYAHTNLSSQTSAGILYRVWRCVKIRCRAKSALADPHCGLSTTIWFAAVREVCMCLWWFVYGVTFSFHGKQLMYLKEQRSSVRECTAGADELLRCHPAEIIRDVPHRRRRKATETCRTTRLRVHVIQSRERTANGTDRPVQVLGENTTSQGNSLVTACGCRRKMASPRVTPISNMNSWRGYMLSQVGTWK